MQIYECLKADHDQIKALLDILLRTPEGQDIEKNLIDQIRDLLIPHARAEEAVFYNSLRSVDVARDLVHHGYKEHVEAEALLRMMQAKVKMDMDCLQTASNLRQALEHHIQQEEGSIFTMARSILTEPEAEQMGRAFEALKPKVRQEGLAKTTLDLVMNLMPPRFSKLLWNDDKQRSA